MHSLRRKFVLAIVAVIAYVTLLPTPSFASGPSLDQLTPKQRDEVSWYWHAMQTKQEMYFAGIILQTPQANCVIDLESRYAGEFVADNHVGYTGAFQFGRQTGDFALGLIGHPEYVGQPAKYWPWYIQTLAFGVIWNRDDGSDWAHPRCQAMGRIG